MCAKALEENQCQFEQLEIVVLSFLGMRCADNHALKHVK